MRHVQDGYGLTLVLTILTIGCLAATGVGTAGACSPWPCRAPRSCSPSIRRALVQPSFALPGSSSSAAIAASGLALAFGDPAVAEAAVGTIGFAIAAIVPIVIMSRIVRSDEITYRLVIGALVVYLLIGLCYAYVFGLITLASGDPFFAQTTTPTTATYIYFSYTTLSTVGYGDYSAATPLGQIIAISEALFGQLYLVSIVAILVANVGRSFREVKSE